MSIVKETIELPGGGVEFASALGVGTTVTLWLLPASPAT
jgi:signal transduction histidine kinase